MIFALIFSYLIFLLITCPNFISSEVLPASYSEGCGITKGCFFAPINCERNANMTCTSIFMWTIDGTKLIFTIEGKLVAPFNTNGPNNYAAVGLSKDQFMGEDMVLICLGGFGNSAGVIVGWNDKNRNYLLPEVTVRVIRDTGYKFENGRIRCEAIYNFTSYDSIPVAYKYLTHDLSEPTSAWHILFARGTAESYSKIFIVLADVLAPHSLVDGEEFPWISTETIRFCSGPGQCNDPAVYKSLIELHQSSISRTIKYGVAVSHGITMVACWWILVSSGILTARYAKKYPHKFLGADLWFQIHRLLMSLAFIFVTISYFLIFWQANFRFIECTIACPTDDYSKQLHALIGTIIYCLMVLQILSGIFRPSIVNPLRPYFNWLHTLNGFGIWAGASTNCILAISIPKTGLGDNYGKIPNHVMMVTILVFVLTVAACEWFANSTRWHPPHPDAVQKLNEEEKNPDDEPSLLATVMIFFNASCGIAAATIIGIMLVNIMRESLK